MSLPGRLHAAASRDIAFRHVALGHVETYFRSSSSSVVGARRVHQIGCKLQLVGPEMRRNPVRSKSIASIGYLPAERELEIKFRASGDVYRYFDVPPEEYAAFLAAESKGTYLNQVFKPREYRYVVVSEARKSRV
jgi:KTSC domain